MMTESNNLLYHPNGASFDRLEEMEGGALTRYPVLGSVPIPAPRPWGTRGAVALLIVCGVVFGVIAAVSLNGSPDSSDVANTENQANANIGGVSTTSDSGSIGITAVESGSLRRDGSSFDPSVGESLDSTSQHAWSGESSDLGSFSSSSDQGSIDAGFGSSASSALEDMLSISLENSESDSQQSASETSSSCASNSQSSSIENDLNDLLLGSVPINTSLDDWFAKASSTSEDVLGNSASAADWDSSLSSTASQSEDSSLGF
ncbi:unnamed protein product [Phytophthora fragariaefolia]|uniref:Unnamed protein product n=1 Tax=Phytophthora fragariaefolia TaxID=1490495 RepID=A0A9W7CSE0_9STRA|nr:unnamed protein product [Phytophthora fragariaefolia]